MFSGKNKSCLFRDNHGYIFRSYGAVAAAIPILVYSASASAGPPTAQELLSLTTSCQQVSDGKFRIDQGAPATVPICGLKGAVFWKADMDIDCDGKPSPQCNKKTDPMFEAMTSAVDSKGEWLNAAELPWVTVPIRSRRFDFKRAGLVFGSVIAAIYNGRVVYGVFGDENGDGIIGEASYAMAAALGIDPDPREGGVDPRAVTYIAFTGLSGVVRPIESHAAAVEKGRQLADKLMADN
jgi:glycosyl hydrolase group 75 (putative chitosanase)